MNPNMLATNKLMRVWKLLIKHLVNKNSFGNKKGNNKKSLLEVFLKVVQ